MKRLIPVFTAIVLILLVVGVSFGLKLRERYTYSTEKADLNSYYGLSQENQAAVVMGNDMLDEKAQMKDGECYLPYDMVCDYFVTSRFYVGEGGKEIRYAMPDRIISALTDGSASYKDGDTQVPCDHAVAYYDGDTLYMSISFIRLFKVFDYSVYANPNRVQINVAYQEQQTAELKKNAQVRVRGGVKSEILEAVTKGSKVIVLETLDHWTKVKTSDAVIGYVPNSALGDVQKETPQFADASSQYGDAQYTSISKQYKINLAWHQVSGIAGNDSLSSLLTNTKALNTVSPTWFYIKDDSANIESFASQGYVDTAHAKGLEVWAKIDDFTADINHQAIFSTAALRSNLISQLMNQVQTYGIDGINIDFEKVPQEAGPDYVEFIRELSIQCRAAQIVLSVDDYPPSGGTSWYNRAEQGVFADYVIIMGYDENYAGSKQAGSVASINYVEAGIKDTLEDVPAEKLINAIPFYTRIWTTAGTEISSKAVGMADAQAFLAQNGMTAAWDDTTCQNYAELQSGNNFYQVWLEDAASVQTKLNVMSNYKLAGVAEWKLGLETPDVWDEIAAYVGAAG